MTEYKCQFCINIETLQKQKKGPFQGWYTPTKNGAKIVKRQGKFYLWSDGGGNPFLSGTDEFGEIFYCPYCGRELRPRKIGKKIDTAIQDELATADLLALLARGGDDL